MEDQEMSVARIEHIEGRRRLVVDRVVDAPTAVVWDVLTDTERWPEWGPSVRSVESTDRHVTVGTTGRVETPVGVWVPFEITRCEPYRWEWRVARIPATGHAVQQLGSERCRVSFDMPVLASGYAPVCRRALSRIEAIATRDR